MAQLRRTVHVDGLSDLQEALAQLPKATARNVLKRALERAGQPIAQEMALHAPVRRGRLMRSIAVSTRLTRRQRAIHRRWAGTTPAMTPEGWRSKPASEVFVFIGPGPVRQAVPQEFGTVHNPPHPFARPAWDARQDAALSSIKADIAAEIEAARKRLARKAERDAARMKR